MKHRQVKRAQFWGMLPSVVFLPISPRRSEPAAVAGDDLMLGLIGGPDHGPTWIFAGGAPVHKP